MMIVFCLFSRAAVLSSLTFLEMNMAQTIPSVPIPPPRSCHFFFGKLQMPHGVASSFSKKSQIHAVNK